MGSREKSCIRHKVIWGACRPQTPDVWVDLVTKRDRRERWMDVYRVPTSNHLSFLFHQKENISSLTWVGHRINTVISWMKEKLLVAQWCLTHCDPMDYSPQAPLFKEFSRQDYRSWFTFPPPGDLPNQGSNLSLPNCRQIVYHLSYQGSPSIVNEVKWSEVTQSCLSLCSPMDCSL